jgi:hypothetical protein
MKARKEGMQVQRHSFLTLALGSGEWSVSRSGHFPPGKIPPSTHCTSYSRLGRPHSRSGRFSGELSNWHGVTAAMPIPAAVQFKTWVFGLSPAGIVSSNPAGGMDVCVL